MLFKINNGLEKGLYELLAIKDEQGNVLYGEENNNINPIDAFLINNTKGKNALDICKKVHLERDTFFSKPKYICDKDKVTSFDVYIFCKNIKIDVNAQYEDIEIFPYEYLKMTSEVNYINSFFKNMNIAVSTARAGNVIGGGDFASDRIIPDCIRAAIKHEDIVVRNPFSTRPYQHVLEPIYAYLMIAQKQYEDIKYAGYYNVGPDDRDCFQTGALVDLFVKHWGEGMKWIDKYDGGPHEANFLKLDCSKLKKTFGWQPHWDLNIAIEKVVEWSKCWLTNGDIEKCMNKQIEEFMKVGK
mgnify:CR=1 FL=1